MSRSALVAILLAAVTAVAAAPPARAQMVNPNEYCVPERKEYDPPDVVRPDKPPVGLPPGSTMRRVRVAGYETIAIEAGPQDSREAVVFMHGNPGNSLDFIGLLRAVPPGARLVAVDLLGFGQADKPWDFPFTFAAARPLVDRLFDDLGIDRMHLVGHDVGSVVAIDWAARHPQRLASATFFAGGVMIGYVDHHFARIWKTPGLGEMMMAGTDRESFVNVIGAHNPRPLPREFVDRNYDAFDRPTRCSVLKLYRAMPDMTALGRAHAAALRPHDRPALIVWGDRDPFLPVHMAFANREGFPRADIHIFERSGHWPFVDEEQRTVDLMSRFLRRHITERAGAAIGLSVTPRRVRAGRRTRILARVTVGRAAQPLPGAVVRIGGRSARSDSRGQATLAVRLRRPGLVRASAAKPPLVPASQPIRVVRGARR